MPSEKRRFLTNYLSNGSDLGWVSSFSNVEMTSTTAWESLRKKYVLRDEVFALNKLRTEGKSQQQLDTEFEGLLREAEDKYGYARDVKVSPVTSTLDRYLYFFDEGETARSGHESRQTFHDSTSSGEKVRSAFQNAQATMFVT